MKIVKPKLIKLSIADIRSYGPCYDPAKHALETWHGTALDVLKMKTVKAEDRVWVVCREDILSSKLLRIFAVSQAKACRKYLKVSERKEFDRILKVCLKFAEGKTSKDDLDAAWDAAWGAARGAAWDAARGAAWDAARDAARDADRDAAWGAARGAARGAAWDADRDADRDAARDAALEKACKMLSSLIREHYDCRK